MAVQNALIYCNAETDAQTWIIAYTVLIHCVDSYIYPSICSSDDMDKKFKSKFFKLGDSSGFNGSLTALQD